MARAAEAVGRHRPAAAPAPAPARTVAGEEQIRHALLDAAIASILERGFYRASSNEIARRADVTWGAIQYHFGTREELLLAVLERSFDRFVLSLAATELTGVTVRARLAALARVGIKAATQASEVAVGHVGTGNVPPAPPVPPWAVLAQTPSAGVRVDQQTAVKLTVAK